MRPAVIEMLEPRQLLTAAAVVELPASQNLIQAPVLSGFGGTLTYVQQGATRLLIASAITVSDGSSTTLASATISFTNWQVGDRLAFNNSASLQYSTAENLTAHTFSLTLSGTRTLASYQQELRSLGFFNVAGAPVTSTRSVSVQVNDGYSASNIVSESIQFGQSPVITGFSGSVTYVKGGAPLAFATNVVISDSLSSTLSSALVTFSNWNAGDRLSFSNSASLQHQFVENFEIHTATLTLSGTANLAAYQTELRSLTFANVAGSPVSTPRTVALQVNDENSTSATVSETITFGNAPVLSRFGGTLTYTQGGTELLFAQSLVVADPGSATLSQATISLTQWQTGDRLAFSSDAGLQYSFSENLTLHTAVLTLTGTRTLADYQAELRTLKFFNVSTNPDATTRTVSIFVNSNGATSNTVSEKIAFQLAAPSAPTVSISPASTTEGDLGNKLLPFVVTLSHAWTTAVTVTYTTSDRSANAGSDYVATTGTLTIPAGQISGTINVSIIGDTAVEPDETFLVTLSNPHSATLGTASATGTILDDDGSGVHLVSDNTSDSSAGTTVIDSTHYLAASFTTGPGFAYLQSISLLLAASSATGSATVQIYSGTATAPQTAVGTLISPATYSTSLASTVFTTNGFILMPNTVYWVVLKPTSGNFRWSTTNSTKGSGSGFTGVSVSSSNAGATWSQSSNLSGPQMKVLVE